MTAIRTVDDVAPELKRGDRFMGLDLGTKTIGIALSDVERSIASALKTIQRRKFSEDAAELLAIAAHYQVVAFVIGLPLNHGWQRRSAGAIDEGLRALARAAHVAGLHLLG